MVEENQKHSRSDPPYSLPDTGIFQDGRYWDMEISYAKKTPRVILLRIRAVN